jgi:tetratricopeptide (TPR) repeat protein
MLGVSSPVEVFYSYAHEDKALRAELEKHLSLLRRLGVISGWHDRRIAPGTDWAQAIDEHLERAAVILLLVSADFLASDYCYGIEMQRALVRHQANEARVIPILLRSVDWHGAPFAHLQALPTDARPITTWRNRDAAFTDVAAGIRRVVEDLSSLQAAAPLASLPLVWNVPFPQKQFFTGREALLKRLHTQLRTAQTAALGQAISGLGGIGKTQLAVKYAYRHQLEYRAVLWAYAETTEALTTSYTEIARLLQLPQKDAKEQEEIIQGVKDWLSNHQNWLLILDNADEPDVLIPFLPPKVGGHLIVTTRAADLSNLGLGFGHVLTVQKFTKQQDVPFLLRRAGLKRVSSQDREYARRIANELDGLPLALNQAGVYLATTGSSLASYWELYQQQRATLLHTLKDREYPRSVAKTLLLSFERVEQRNPAAADLLRLCAFLAPDVIPEELLTKGARELGNVLAPVVEDAHQFNQALADLRAYSLLTRYPQSRTLIVHRLVQAVLRDSMTTETQQQWMQRVVLAVNAAFPGIKFEDWPICERLLPHALICATWIEQVPFVPAAAHLLNQVGYYLINRGRYMEAELLLKRALAIREQDLDPMHLDTALSLNDLATLYQRQGKYEQAELLYQRALAIREHLLGAEHLDTPTICATR